MSEVIEKEQLFFTDEEYEKIIIIACGAEGGATEEQIKAFIGRCEDMKANQMILESIMRGVLIVRTFEGQEAMFAPPTEEESESLQKAFIKNGKVAK